MVTDVCSVVGLREQVAGLEGRLADAEAAAERRKGQHHHQVVKLERRVAEAKAAAERKEGQHREQVAELPRQLPHWDYI